MIAAKIEAEIGSAVLSLACEESGEVKVLQGNRGYRGPKNVRPSVFRSNILIEELSYRRIIL